MCTGFRQIHTSDNKLEMATVCLSSKYGYCKLEPTVIKPTTKTNVKLNTAQDMNVLKGTRGKFCSSKTFTAASLDPFVLIIIKLIMNRN